MKNLVPLVILTLSLSFLTGCAKYKNYKREDGTTDFKTMIKDADAWILENMW